jgi:hypothetical protein
MIIRMFHVKPSANSNFAERPSTSSFLRDSGDVSRETVPFVAPTPDATSAGDCLDPTLNSPHLKMGQRRDERYLFDHCFT